MEDSHEYEPPDDGQADIGVARYRHMEEVAFRADGKDAAVNQIEVTDLDYLPATRAAVIAEYRYQPNDSDDDDKQRQQE